MGALNSSGFLVPASDAAGLRVVGRIEETVDNSAGSDGAAFACAREGVFLFDNSGTNAVDAADAGKECYVEDDYIVAETSTHKVKAGRVVEVVTGGRDAGVWVDCRSGQASRVPNADSLTALSFSTTATGAEVGALRDALLAILQNQGFVK
jgi:hypothetical protein